MTEMRRRPRVFDADDPKVQLTAPDAPEVEADANAGRAEEAAPGAAADARDEGLAAQTLAPAETQSGWSMLSVFISVFFALSSLALGLWFTRFISVALARNDWIGWVANGLALVMALIIAIVFVREIIGFLRLARLGRLRRDASEAIASGDRRQEERVAARLKGLMSGRPEYRWALAAFREKERHQTAPGALLGLADTVLLKPADSEARRVIYESARRVAVVTAVVPITFIAMLFVLFENIRMARRLAGTYGGRPGLIGGSRLLMRVIFHIAATGAIALTDDLFGQFLGQDLVRRVSRRLGEGAFNGALTARLGIVAIELIRPCPYLKAKPLRARHVVAELFPEFNASDLMSRAVGRKREANDDASRTS
jgi:putative membrane protein